MDKSSWAWSAAIVLAATLTAPLRAGAVLTQYTDLASFQAATASPTVETYTNISPQTAPYYISVDGATINGISYSGGYSYVIDPLYNPLNFDWGTGAVLELGNMGAVETLTFSKPVTAFGALFGNILPNSSEVFTFVPGNPTLGPQTIVKTSAFPTLTFMGWTSSTPFNSVTIQASDAYTILDNVTFATAVPEPSTSTMILSGLCLIAVAAFRRRNQ